jgi:hypothetical protein
MEMCARKRESGKKGAKEKSKRSNAEINTENG